MINQTKGRSLSTHVKSVWIATDGLHLCIGTIKIWLYLDTGSNHSPCPGLLSAAAPLEKKHELGPMDTAYITHNHTHTHI